MITTENAAQLARLGAETRRGGRFIPAEQLKWLQSGFPVQNGAVQSTVQTVPEVLDERVRGRVKKEVASLERQIDQVDKDLAACSDASDWHKLATGKAKLLELWCRLVGIPKEATPKLVQTTSKRSKPANLSPID